jgi:ATP-dependent DNA helicase RecQ
MVLVVQRTGLGQERVYFVADGAAPLGAGPTLIVSPLELDAQSDRGGRTLWHPHRADHEDNKDEWEGVVTALERDELDVLLVALERFGNASFVRDVLPMVTKRWTVSVIDEAPLASVTGGHDFRPDYRRASQVCSICFRQTCRCCARRATANDRVRHATIAEVLSVADGCIVGSALKVDGNTWNPVDPERAADFMARVRAARA